MSKGPKLALTVLLLGSLMSAVAIVLTIGWNWLFRGEAGISRDTIYRMVLIGFVIAAMPLGLIWARPRKNTP